VPEATGVIEPAGPVPISIVCAPAPTTVVIPKTANATVESSFPPIKTPYMVHEEFQYINIFLPNFVKVNLRRRATRRPLNVHTVFLKCTLGFLRQRPA
jgi:hypothetical protein